MMATTVAEKFESDQEKTQIAKIIGLCFIAMFLLGIFAEFAVRTQLIQWGDPLLTYSNIQRSFHLYNTGIFAFLVIVLLDVVLSIAFYVLLVSLSRFLAFLMVSLRLVYVAIKGMAIATLVLAGDIASATEANVNSPEAIASQTMHFLKLHNTGFAIALIFFGFHLIMLALLLSKAYRVPRLIVWTLAVAGVGYGLNSMTSLFAPDSLLSTIIIIIFIFPMTFSELCLGLWLWVKRKKIASLVS